MCYEKENKVIAQWETDYSLILCQLVHHKWAIQKLLRSTLDSIVMTSQLYESFKSGFRWTYDDFIMILNLLS